MRSPEEKAIFIIVIIFLGLACVAAAGVYFYVGSVMAQSAAPRITNLKIEEITENSVKITWETDKNADSGINFGLDRRFGVARDPGTNKKAHEILLDELKQGTRYYFRAVSTDESGNQGISGVFNFVTKGVSDLAEIEELLKRIKDEATLLKILEMTKEAATGLTDTLTIIGPPKVDAGIDSAVISWETSRPADSKVFFAKEDEYSPGSDNPYTHGQIGLEGDTTNHMVEIIGLEPHTLYHFKVASEDSFGLIGESEDHTFRTKALLPIIQGFQTVKVEERTATLTWSTTIPSSALVEYQNLTTGERFSKGSPTLTTRHTLQLDELRFGTRYRAVAVAESLGGETVRSTPIEFVTIRDVSPPIISRVSNESTLYPGVETKVQTIVSWETDEPSLCRLFYREGLLPTIEPTEVPPRDDNYAQKHVQVIVNFRPSTVYQFWVSCEDRAENQARSENFVLFTPQQEKSIIDIILENFEGTFGWMKNITK